MTPYTTILYIVVVLGVIAFYYLAKLNAKQQGERDKLIEGKGKEPQG